MASWPSDVFPPVNDLFFGAVHPLMSQVCSCMIELGFISQKYFG